MKQIKDPLDIFHSWYVEAKEEKDELAEAFCLSTINIRNKPLSRMVLLKNYSNYRMF